MRETPAREVREAEETLTRERARILLENDRRRREVDHDLYAHDNPTEQLFRRARRVLARRLLGTAGAMPGRNSRCLEIGCGAGGWLADLAHWKAAEKRIFGVEIDLSRLLLARLEAPASCLLAADGALLPFAGGSFDLVLVSTVFSSILEPRVQTLVADEMVRVVAPEGALVCFDFRWNNPRNPHVRAVTRRRLGQLFETDGRMTGRVESVCLAPPLARRLSGWPTLTRNLERVPFLRSHLLAVYRREA